MKTENEAARGTVTIGISASIAAFRMCDLILTLRKRGFKIIPIFSKDAHHFVTPLTIQTLAKTQVYQDMFYAADSEKPVHIDIAGSSDIIVLAPATADLIAKISLGLAGDLLSCTVLSASCPVIVVPAMNDIMYNNPATQENIAKLKKRGFKFVGPIEGDLTCDKRAFGHIADNETVINEILATIENARK
jgi:phosphopantothenoylcysteine decarboxylase/phosphopantothenate--cysteine ligase